MCHHFLSLRNRTHTYAMRIFRSSEYDCVSLGKVFWTFWRTVMPSSSWPSILLGLLDTKDRGTNYHLLKYQDLDLQYHHPQNLNSVPPPPELQFSTTTPRTSIQYHHPQNLKYCMLWEIYYIFLVWNFSFFFGHNSPPMGQGLPIHKISRSRTTTHHSR